MSASTRKLFSDSGTAGFGIRLRSLRWCRDQNGYKSQGNRDSSHGILPRVLAHQFKNETPENKWFGPGKTAHLSFEVLRVGLCLVLAQNWLGTPVSTGERDVSGSAFAIQRRSTGCDCTSLYSPTKYCLYGSNLRTSDTGSPNTYYLCLSRSPRTMEPVRPLRGRH